MSTLVEDRRKPVNSRTFRRAQAALVMKGYSYRSWAEEKGYVARTVIQAVHRYAGTQDQPRGRLTWKILCDLSRDTGIELVPGSLKEAA
ncbi:MAG: hypothetical protein WAO12_07695 [Venatoribacter sp.]